MSPGDSAHTEEEAAGLEVAAGPHEVLSAGSAGCEKHSLLNPTAPRTFTPSLPY